jgi:hypothetical protein
MLDLRPTCENCNLLLPPHSLDAMICSFECTFCRNCVEKPLWNVCPNCGGGFCPRPVRPKHNWKDGEYLGVFPASTKVKHRPVNVIQHKQINAVIKAIPPEQR